MFSEATTIINRMFGNVPPDVDISEGSFVWDVLSTVSIELALAYINLDITHQQTYVGGASGANLDKRVGEMGVTRLPASSAIGQVVFEGVVGAVIPAGSLVGTKKGTQYQTDTEVAIGSDGTVLAAITAENVGSNGNVPSNEITIISVSMVGVTLVNNQSPTYGGRNEETDDALRDRYYKEVGNKSIDGNMAQYQKWASDYQGIGRAKIFPLWAGVNTVKISILSTENEVASAGLIADFQLYMDPDSSGLGNGVAPIGSKVTVTTATPVSVNVSADVVLASGYSDISGVNESLTAYLGELAYNKTSVSYMGIGANILSVPAVDQIKNMVINGSTADILLTPEQIPELGAATWTVIDS